MTSVAVLIPVLGRPHRVEALTTSLTASYDPADLAVRADFLCSPDDAEEIAAVHAVDLEPVVVPFEQAPGDYARKMNYGYRLAVLHGFDWAFLAADDLAFHPGWIDAALAEYGRTDACVIGTNDLGNAKVMRGDHATHSFVHRDYGDCGTIDEPGLICHEGYGHQWVDNELVETAQWRGTFAFAADSVVEHLHPFWHKGDDDSTYRKGQASSREDAALFQRRRRLWA